MRNAGSKIARWKPRAQETRQLPRPVISTLDFRTSNTDQTSLIHYRKTADTSLFPLVTSTEGLEENLVKRINSQAVCSSSTRRSVKAYLKHWRPSSTIYPLPHSYQKSRTTFGRQSRRFQCARKYVGPHGVWKFLQFYHLHGKCTTKACRYEHSEQSSRQ